MYAFLYKREGTAGKFLTLTRRREIGGSELTLFGPGAKGTGLVMKKDDQFPRYFRMPLTSFLLMLG